MVGGKAAISGAATQVAVSEGLIDDDAGDGWVVASGEVIIF